MSVISSDSDYTTELLEGTYREDSDVLLRAPEFEEDETVDREVAYVNFLRDRLNEQLGRSFSFEQVWEVHRYIRDMYPTFMDGEEELFALMYEELRLMDDDDESEESSGTQSSSRSSSSKKSITPELISDEVDVRLRLQQAADQLERREKDRRAIIEGTRARRIPVVRDINTRTMQSELLARRNAMIAQATRKVKKRTIFDSDDEAEDLAYEVQTQVEGGRLVRPIADEDGGKEQPAPRITGTNKEWRAIERYFAAQRKPSTLDAIGAYLEALPFDFEEGAEMRFYKMWQRDQRKSGEEETPLERWLNVHVGQPIYEAQEDEQEDEQDRFETDTLEEEQDDDNDDEETEGIDIGQLDENDKRYMRKRIVERQLIATEREAGPILAYEPTEDKGKSTKEARPLTGNIIPGRRSKKTKTTKRLLKERPAAAVARFQIITGIPPGTLPLQESFTEEQKEAIQNCCQTTGQLVIATTGFGKTSVILAIATSAQIKDWGQIILVVRASTRKTFEREIRKIPLHYRPNVEMVTHENIGKFKGNKGSVVLIDECQNFAVGAFKKDHTPKQTYQAIQLCANASRVYLFSATPCPSEGSELKSLLYMVKRLAFKSLIDFNRDTLTPYKGRGSLMRRPLATLSNGMLPITYNWQCLVSWYEHDIASVEYKNAFVNLQERLYKVKMTEEERRDYETMELTAGWDDFGNKLEVKCHTKSKYAKMLEILKRELTRFGAPIKPRIMIYAYVVDYARKIHACIANHPDPIIRASHPVLIEAGKFNLNSDYLQPFTSDTGNSTVCVITKAGVTGFDPPRLTSIIAMNAFWIPTLQIQLAGRLNRRNKHIEFNELGLEKTFYIHIILATKTTDEEDRTEAIEIPERFPGKKIKYPYTFDTHQHAVSDNKKKLLIPCMEALYQASRQNLGDRTCNSTFIHDQLRSPIRYR